MLTYVGRHSCFELKAAIGATKVLQRPNLAGVFASGLQTRAYLGGLDGALIADVAVGQADRGQSGLLEGAGYLTI